MIYFDSDMSKSTNTVVYFDWKTVIYIYVCGKCHTQCMLPMEKSVTFIGACPNEIIPSINHSFVYKAKEGRDVIILIRLTFVSNYIVSILPLFLRLFDCMLEFFLQCAIFCFFILFKKNARNKHISILVSKMSSSLKCIKCKWSMNLS
jgi:hypothetical protein